MRAVIQRVRSAVVHVDGEQVSSIKRGLMCLIGISTTDTEYEREWLATKILNLKLFPEDKDGESWGWKNSVLDAGYEVLCVSQFTLQANLRKGSKPDFHGAMGAETSKAFYDAFLEDMRRKYQADKILDGKFGAMMDVSLVNDGPVTLILDSTTDAPAPPVKKPSATREQKQKAKEKAERRAALAKTSKESRAKLSDLGIVEGTGEGVGGDAAVQEVLLPGITEERQALLVDKAADRKEEELIREAEKAAADLAQRFKVTVGTGL
ncbi:hypothetical protein JCM11641_000040 [Rhodosporidiobolus odoratus]